MYDFLQWICLGFVMYIEQIFVKFALISTISDTKVYQHRYNDGVTCVAFNWGRILENFNVVLFFMCFTPYINLHLSTSI